MTVIDVRVPPRHVPLDTVFNLRDLGGHRTTDGRRVASGAHLRRTHGGAAGYLEDQGVGSLTIEDLSARMLTC